MSRRAKFDRLMREGGTLRLPDGTTIDILPLRKNTRHVPPATQPPPIVPLPDSVMIDEHDRNQ